jgi:hypothetical protein
MEDKLEPGWDEWLREQTATPVRGGTDRLHPAFEVLDDNWNLSTVERSTPPVRPGKRRASSREIWPRRFADARRHRGEWVKVVTPMTRSTAAQLASDIQRIGLRDAASIRVKGFHEGERWEAVFDNDPADPDTEHYYLWICLQSAAA